MDCKLHFDKFYTEDSRGDFSSIMIDHNNSIEAMRVDEPITCTNAAQDIPIAHSAGPTRPTAGSITFKGIADFLLQIVNGRSDVSICYNLCHFSFVYVRYQIRVGWVQCSPWRL